MAKKTREEKIADEQRKFERMQYYTDKAVEVIKASLNNPLVGSVAAYGLIHVLGNLKRSDGSYYMHEAVVRTLKGLAASYPIFEATKGGTAGVVAAGAAAAAVAVAADRPDYVPPAIPPVYLPPELERRPGYPGYDSDSLFG